MNHQKQQLLQVGEELVGSHEGEDPAYVDQQDEQGQQSDGINLQRIIDW